MSLKAIFKNIKSESSVIKELDKYLFKLNQEGNDRAIDVNSPSQVGTCMRARYYARKNFESDNSIDARTRRIFDNGHKVHERLQNYLTEQGMLLLDEAPVRSDKYNIQGHTDGIININNELLVLEIKSINDRGFAELRQAKEEHKQQGFVYLYCLNERRNKLIKDYATDEDFKKSEKKRYKYYASLYKHIEEGKKHSKDEKIKFQCDLHNKLDTILFNSKSPVEKVVFLYENKNTQDLKEFIISRKSEEYKSMIDDILEDYEILNNFIDSEEVPDREGTSKSCNVCRWCSYINTCWVM